MEDNKETKSEKIFFGLIMGTLFILTGIIYLLNPNGGLSINKGFYQLNTFGRVIAWVAINVGFFSYFRFFEKPLSNFFKNLWWDICIFCGAIIFSTSAIHSLVTKTSWGLFRTVNLDDNFMYWMEAVYLLITIILLIFYLFNRKILFQENYKHLL